MPLPHKPWPESMMLPSVRGFGIAVIFGALPALQASATPVVFFDNFGPGDGYLAGGWTETGASSVFGGPTLQAMSFTPGTNGTVTSLTSAMTFITGTNAVVINLETDSGGAP